ncbi:glycosyltransferase family 2 protein [Pseudomonas cremoricolorata]|uniref:Glycosyl transferase family 2 n=1 Tax=Pseudomonas cremoricolorata TaxID=157783 RepID=A0A089WUC5_9PSED|nr:glycosyltransferase [Pseudomonas cremoricolorata]AIR90819.1 glycosyl transferase family 2 [Pseudomonas cremoricolorata]
MVQLSVVVPMYNEARHIARSLAAVRRAAVRAGLSFELIVVDNGSDDDGPRIARQAGARVLSRPGLRIGALRNQGAALSRGEWLAFIDADIEVPERWLTRLLRLHREQRGEVFALDCDTPAAAPWYARAWQRRTLRSGALQQAARWLPSANLLLPRDCFEAVGGFDEGLTTGEDKDLTVRLHQAGVRLLAVREPVVLHWGFEGRWGEWLGKEMWRQGSHLHLLRSHGHSVRMLRFPLLSVAVWAVDGAAVLSAFLGYVPVALGLLLLGTLPALILSARQSLGQRDLLLGLQLWWLHWIRLHLAGIALLLSLFNRPTRRPSRG